MSKHREVQFNRQIDALRYQNRKLEEENNELGCEKGKLEHKLAQLNEMLHTGMQMSRFLN